MERKGQCVCYNLISIPRWMIISQFSFKVWWGTGRENRKIHFFTFFGYKIVLFFIYCHNKRQPEGDHSNFIIMNALIDLKMRVV